MRARARASSIKETPLGSVFAEASVWEYLFRDAKVHSDMGVVGYTQVSRAQIVRVVPMQSLLVWDAACEQTYELQHMRAVLRCTSASCNSLLV